MTDDTKPKRPGRRCRPHWWAAIIILAPVAVIVWLRTGDRTGDSGMMNVFSGMLAVLAVGLFLLWFIVAARGFRLRTRLLSVLGFVLGVIVLLNVFRPVAWSGSMVPVFAPRWKETAQPAAPMPAPAAGRAVDLATTNAHDFPAFLGPGRDLHVAGVELDRDWKAHPPVELWRQPIGAGWSGFAIVNGVAVTQEEREGRQLVTAYDAATGDLLWSHGWSGEYAHALGGPGPRATPTIDDGYVYALGPFGRLVCLDGADGAVVWDLDLPTAFEIDPDVDRAIVGYGRSNSPLVHGDLLIVPVGGGPVGDRANLVAFDKRTGDTVWTGSRRRISYSSPAVATLAGVEQVLIVNESSVSGHDPATGAQLWTHPWPGRSNADASASQAVPLAPSSVFVSKGYGVGSARFDLAAEDDGTFAVTQRWHARRSLRTKFTNAMVRDGHAYGLSDGILECIELEGGRRKWKDGRYGHGQILGVGDLLLVLSEDGELALVEPDPDEANRVLGRLEAIEGMTWNNLAFSGDTVFVRNGFEAAAFRLATREGPP